MEVCGLWRFNCNLPSQSRWCVNYEYLWQVPVPCWSPQIIASVRGSIQRLMIHEREVIYLVLGRNLQAMLTISIITLSHMCAYSSQILRLKMINNKSIEAIELSKMYTTWHLGKGDTEWDNPPHRFQTGWCWLPISGSYLGYWTCRIYIYRWMVGPLWIYIIYFCLGRGLEITGKPYFFSFFLFPTVNIV